MKSVIEVSGNACFCLKRIAKKVALDVITIMGQPNCLEVSISFVSEEEIKRLNLEFRNIDKVTDVLSFPSTTVKAGNVLDVESEEILFLLNDSSHIHFGDIAICLKRLKDQAKEYGVKTKQELKKLVIHSMLHLMGYDHIKDSDYEIMNKKEIELDNLINI